MDDASDPTMRAALKTAQAWGVSLRRFLGWEPTRTTVHVYDSSGRLIRSITATEAEWDDESRELALSLERFQAEQCPGCSEPLGETTDPENEFRYVPDAPLRCHRCTAIAIASDGVAQNPHSSALLIPVRLKGGAAHGPPGID